MKDLNAFVEEIVKTKKVWLLEAMTGMFAMLQDADDNSYVPLWDNEDDARNAANGDWASYEVTDMDFSELKSWLRELSRDEIDIAVAPEKDGEITAISSANFAKWVSQYADDSYKEPADDDDDKDDFDYGDGWAEEWH